MPWDDFDDPECPECGSESGECGCDRPFNFPTIYMSAPSPKKLLCKQCKKSKRVIYEDLEYDLCRACLDRCEDEDKHIITYAVIA